MRNTSRFFRLISLLFLLLVGISISAQAQEKIIIQAYARGTSTQMGKMFPVKIFIDQISTDEDQMKLIEAFKRSGNDGMVDALASMSEKGRIAFEGRVGNVVRYIRELPSKNGRRFRLVSDRYVFIAELREGTRSSEYSIGAVELTITPDGKGSSGTLLPACKLKVNKQKQIEIESYQNPWELTDFIVTTGK